MKQQKTVFFAEDDEDNADLILEMLAALDYKAVRARHGMELLAQVANYVPDVILLDLEMPVLNGFETLAILKQDSRFASVPVIAISGKTDEGLAADVKTSGFTSFLAKPFNK